VEASIATRVMSPGDPEKFRLAVPLQVPSCPVDLTGQLGFEHLIGDWLLGELIELTDPFAGAARRAPPGEPADPKSPRACSTKSCRIRGISVAVHCLCTSPPSLTRGFIVRRQWWGAHTLRAGRKGND